MDGTELTFTEQVTPYLPLIGIAISALIVGGFAAWNRAKGNVETKAPSVAEIWAREERLNHRVSWLGTAAWKIQSAYRRYVSRVQAGGSTDLTTAEQSALELDLSEDN